MRVIAVLAVAVAVGRIVATYPVFVQTYDEPVSIATGLEWIDKGTYTYERLHPPLRTVFAAGPYLLGARSNGDSDIRRGGNAILYADAPGYFAVLTAARIGALPFFVLACLGVFVLGRMAVGSRAALAAVVIFTLTPTVLAHASLATNDILLAATLPLALYGVVRMVDTGTTVRAALAGGAVAAAVLSKFTAIPFLIGAGGAVGLVHCVLSRTIHWPHRPRRTVSMLLAFGCSLVVVIWAAYRWSLGPLAHPEARPYETIDAFVGADGPVHDVLYSIVELPVPAPDFVRGLQDANARSARGHLSFFLGELGTSGRPMYFPAVLAAKTPLPVLLLIPVGLLAVIHQVRRRANPVSALPAAAAIGLLAVSLTLTINIGVRHVLAIYPLLSIVAAQGLELLWESRRVMWRAVVALMFVWLTVDSARAHPDYLAYFNEAFRTHPERLFADSNLDWGQDLLRLEQEVKARRISELWLSYFGTADPARHGLAWARTLPPRTPVQGWIAVSETDYALYTGQPPYDRLSWLSEHRPVAIVGRTIRLYFVGPAVE